MLKSISLVQKYDLVSSVERKRSLSFHQFRQCQRGFSSVNISTSDFIIPDRLHIQVAGKDAKKFLQGICTNDITKFDGKGIKAIAAAFLTTKVCYLSDHACKLGLLWLDASSGTSLS
jgi:glycine cleavage system aminomethyltransferase T